MRPIIFIIGVSGCGKSTIGELLSQKNSIPFFDGDDFHPQSNIDKMVSGKPLNDDDRKEWLMSLNHHAKKHSKLKGAIIACSALKESYRKILSNSIEDNVKWVFLKGNQELILSRLESRANHFMNPGLLQSQFDTLEIPDYGMHIDISQTPEALVKTINSIIKMEFGIIGLGVMGKSLARNFANNGFSLSLFNRHVDDVEEDIAQNFIQNYPELNKCHGYDDLEAFVNSLETPRKILIMVNAGKAIDMVIDNLLNYIQSEDIIIDGGNSHYKNTEKRFELLSTKNIHFIGMGVSGGEEGALNGPSLMPGGNANAYELVKDYLQKIAAKDQNGNPCCQHIGADGAGHFVKMVHNGIEYAEMQIIAELYSVLRFGNNMTPLEIASVFESWNEGKLKNYLLGITIDILRKKEGESHLIDLILDQSSHKGTGSWTTIASAELGVPFTMSSAALNARYISALKAMRVSFSELYDFQKKPSSEIDTETLKNTYQTARIINHHQGLQVIETASNTYEWDIDLKNTASVWTNGCIIASELMQDLISILSATNNILESKSISEFVTASHSDFKNSVVLAIDNNIAVPCLSEALNFLNAITQADGTGNIIQAQRDYFGAHTYKRKDNPEGPSHHTNWKQ